MASKIQAALDDAKTFQQMMAMDGEIPIGKPNEENNFGLMGSEAQRYRSANYVVTVTARTSIRISSDASAAICTHLH